MAHDHADEFLPGGMVLEERWAIEERIGQGGFATVYRGRHITLERLVAIKVLEAHALPGDTVQFQQRFLSEAKLAASLEHPNVVDILDYGFLEWKGQEKPFIVMEYLRGHDLETELLTHGPLSPDRAKRLFEGALGALKSSHERGVVHRDLKPSNLFVLHPGEESERMMVVDFGIARVFEDPDAKLTATNQYTGTPAYLAPEYIEAHTVTPALDVYQMGLIIGEALSGTPVVQASSPLAYLMAHCNGEQTLPEMFHDTELGAVLTRAISVNPEDRHPDAGALRAALHEVSWDISPAMRGAVDSDFATSETLAAEPLKEPVGQTDAIIDAQEGATPPPPIPSASSSRATRGVAILGVLAAITALAAVGAWWAVRDTTPSPTPVQAPIAAAQAATEQDLAAATPTASKASSDDPKAVQTPATGVVDERGDANDAKVLDASAAKTAQKEATPDGASGQYKEDGDVVALGAAKPSGALAPKSAARRPANVTQDEPIELLKPAPIDDKLALAFDAYRVVAGEVDLTFAAYDKRVEEVGFEDPGRLSYAFTRVAGSYRGAAKDLRASAASAPSRPALDDAARALATTMGKLGDLSERAYAYRMEQTWKVHPEKLKEFDGEWHTMHAEFGPRRDAFLKALYDAEIEILSERFAKTDARTGPLMHHTHGVLLEGARVMRASLGDATAAKISPHVASARRHATAFGTIDREAALPDIVSSRTRYGLKQWVDGVLLMPKKFAELRQAHKKATTLLEGAKARHQLAIGWRYVHMAYGMNTRRYFEREL